jgi:hypothetical protein
MTIAEQLTSINDSKLAIKAAIETKGVTVGTAAFDTYADLVGDIPSGGSSPIEPYVRNPTWPALPEISTTYGGFVGVYKIEENSNFLAVTLSSAGGHVIDWGDATTSTSSSTSFTAYKEYDYSTISNDTRGPVTFTASTDVVNRTAHGYTDGMLISFAEITTTTGIDVDHNFYVVNATADTLQLARNAGGSPIAFTNDGSGYILKYKTVVVNYQANTPGNLSSINFYVKHNQSGLQNGYSTGWLDLTVSGENISTLTLGNNGSNVIHSNLEQFSLISANTISSFSYFFGRCHALQSVPTFVLRTAGTCSMTNMFNFCYSLKNAPLFTNVSGEENAARITSCDTMFRYCYSLKYIPNYNLSGCSNFNTMMGDCLALEFAPMLNTSAATQMINMFFGSSNLKTCPAYNTSSVTAMGSIFQNCISLQEIPAFNLSAVSSSANLTNWTTGCVSVAKNSASGMRFTHSIANNKMSATSLNAYYTALPTITSQTLTVTGNWGVASDDPTIATAKGWTITG